MIVSFANRETLSRYERCNRVQRTARARRAKQQLRDTVVDLQAAFLRCYDQNDYADLIDYVKEPPTVLEDADRRWVVELLTDAKLR